MRALTALPLVFFVAAIVLACGGDDSGNSGGNSPTQPSNCPSPCMAGALCYQPDPSSNCNGDWYCWDDSLWHCAPPDSGGPGDATVMFDTGAVEAGGDDGPATGDAEAGTEAAAEASMEAAAEASAEASAEAGAD